MLLAAAAAMYVRSKKRQIRYSIL